MTRQHGVLGTAADVVSFAHVGWGYYDHAEFWVCAAEYIADGRRRRQWVEYVGRGTPAALGAELATLPNMRETSESAEVAIRPLEDFYAVRPGTEVVEPEASLAKRVAATEEAPRWLHGIARRRGRYRPGAHPRTARGICRL